jgi:hypothetical protein
MPVETPPARRARAVAIDGHAARPKRRLCCRQKRLPLRDAIWTWIFQGAKDN